MAQESVRLDCLRHYSTFSGTLALRERCAKMRQRGRATFNCDDLDAQFSLFNEHPSHQGRGEHSRASARVEYPKWSA